MYFPGKTFLPTYKAPLLAGLFMALMVSGLFTVPPNEAIHAAPTQTPQAQLTKIETFALSTHGIDIWRDNDIDGYRGTNKTDRIRIAVIDTAGFAGLNALPSQEMPSPHGVRETLTAGDR